MVSVTLKISDELKTKISRLPWVNWSETAREDSIKEIELEERWERLKKIVSKSKLTQEQADKFSDEVNLSLAKRYEGLLRKK